MIVITRRDALKLAAATAVVAPTTASNVTRAQAARLIDAPTLASAYSETANSAVDPEAFAHDVLRHLWTDSVVCETAPEYVAFRKAEAAMYAAIPETDQFRHPYREVSEAMLIVWNAAYVEGLRSGAAAEQFRQVLIGPKKPCWPCHGVGIIKNAACRHCNGAGLVPVSVVQKTGL